MVKKNEKEQVQPVVEEPKDKSMISSEDVEEVVKGDEEALAEQMERIKNLTKEQQIQMMEELKKQQEDLQRKKQLELQQQQQQALKDEQLRMQRQQEAILAQKKQAEEKLRQQQLLAQQQAQQQMLLKQQEEAKKKLAEQQLKDKQSQPNNKEQNIPPAKSVDAENNKGGKNDGPTTFKRVFAAILLIGLMVMIYFLPQISDFVSDFQTKRTQQQITTGVLECSNKKTTDTLDINTNVLFDFSDSKLTKMTYTLIHTGDKLKDKDELKTLNEECLTLQQGAKNLGGVTISCSLKDGINTSKQILDYAKIDVKKATTAYTEAGGTYFQEFYLYQDIGIIESEMTSGGYTCIKK